MGPVDLYLAPAELDYRRETAPAPRTRRVRRRMVGRRAAQPTSRPNVRLTF
jgi:hypothetical protein